MKLFGNSKRAARLAGADASERRQGRNLSDLSEETDQQKKLGKGLKSLLIVLSVLLVLLLAIVLFLKVYVRPPDDFRHPISLDTIDPDTNLPVELPQEAPKKSDGVYTVLLAGTDHDGTRTDTIMLVCLNVNKNRVSLISIPRDTLVETRGGRARINSVYGAFGCGKDGMEALMLEVEDVLGILPTGYVLVDLDAFVELVDTVGGVDFDIPQNMNYEDPTQDLYIHLQKGYQHLDGSKAIQLVRFRSYASADIQRTKVQQDFLRAVASKCLSVENIGKIRDYCEIFNKHVLTNFSVGNLLYFAQELAKCDLSTAESETLPGTSVWVGDAACYKLRESEVKKIIEHHTEP